MEANGLGCKISTDNQEEEAKLLVKWRWQLLLLACLCLWLLQPLPGGLGPILSRQEPEQTSSNFCNEYLDVVMSKWSCRTASPWILVLKHTAWFLAGPIFKMPVTISWIILCWKFSFVQLLGIFFFYYSSALSDSFLVCVDMNHEVTVRGRWLFPEHPGWRSHAGPGQTLHSDQSRTALWPRPSYVEPARPGCSRITIVFCFPAVKCITSQLISANPEILIGSMMPVLFAE